MPHRERRHVGGLLLLRGLGNHLAKPSMRKVERLIEFRTVAAAAPAAHARALRGAAPMSMKAASTWAMTSPGSVPHSLRRAAASFIRSP